MKKTLNKLQWIFTFVLSCVCFVALVCCTNGANDFSLKETKIWLDLYEERDIELASGELSGITWTSDNEAVVTMEKNRAIACGEGKATVTAKSGNKTATLAVQVVDSGERPRLKLSSTEAYLGIALDMSVKAEYLEQEIKLDDFDITIADTSVAAYENGKLTGVALGTTSATVEATYKGLELKNSFTLTCNPRYGIDGLETTYELYDTTTEELNSITLSPVLLDAGQIADNAQFTCTVLTGAEYVDVDDCKLSSKSAVGEATVQVAWTQDADVAQTITVIVHPGYFEENFVNATVMDVTYEKCDDEVYGKTDVWKFQNNEDPAKKVYYDCRIFVSRSQELIRNLYVEGARYFAYNMYYELDPSLTSDTDLYMGVGGSCEYFPVNELFGSNTMMILDDDGKLINRPLTNTWITVVYDLYALLFKNPTLRGEFFLTCVNRSPIYIQNVRYCIDDSFIIKDDAVVYEQKDGYISASANELAVLGHTDANAYMFTTETIGGRDNVMKYTVMENSWSGSLVNKQSIIGDASTSMEALSQYGAYFTFDVYIERATTVSISLNHTTLSANILPGVTDVSDSQWLYLLDENGNRLYTLETGKWITIGYRFRDNFDSSGAAFRSTIMFSSQSVGDTFYIDNLRYYQDSSHISDTFAGIEPPKGVTVTFYGESVSNVTEGKLKDSVLYRNTVSANNHVWGMGLKFTDVIGNMSSDGNGGSAGTYFNDAENRFMSFEMYIGSNVTKIGYFAQSSSGADVYWSSGYDGYAVDGVCGDGMRIYDQNGRSILRLEREVWYKVYIPMEKGNGNPAWVSMILHIYGGTEDNPAELYVRNIAPVHEDPYYEDNQVFEYTYNSGYNINLSKTEFENEQVVRYVDGTSNNWDGGVRFVDVNERYFFENNKKYIQFDFYIESGTTLRAGSWNTIGINWYSVTMSERKIGASASTDGAIIYDSTGAKTTLVEIGKWYTFLLPMTVLPGTPEYTNTFFYVGSETGSSVTYLKNLRYLDYNDTFSKINTVNGYEKMGVEGYDNAVEYVSTSDDYWSGWDDGFTFSDLAKNGSFYRDGYRFLEFDVYFKDTTTDVMMSVMLDMVDWSNFGQKQKIRISDGKFTMDGMGSNAKLEVVVKDENGNYCGLGNDSPDIVTGKWYTVQIRLIYTTIPTHWSPVHMQLNNGGACYLKDVEYKTNGDLMLELSLDTDGGAITNSFSKAKGVGFENALKYTVTGTGSWNRGIMFNRVESSEFSSLGYNYLSFKVYFEDGVTDMYMGVFLNGGGYSQKISYTLGKELDSSSMTATDVNGNAVTKIKANGWYTLTFKVENIDCAGKWNIVNFAAWASSGNTVSTYIKDLRYFA